MSRRDSKDTSFRNSSIVDGIMLNSSKNEDDKSKIIPEDGPIFVPDKGFHPKVAMKK